MQCNTYKTLSVISRCGEVIYLLTGIPGGRNDREVWTSCDLYLNPHNYFSPGEWLAVDGGFIGDGPTIHSYNDMRNDEDKADFNMVFTEVRKQVENTFGRVQMWFPIHGNLKKRWDCGQKLFKFTVKASFLMHNWIMRIRNLNYCPSTNPNYLYIRYL